MLKAYIKNALRTLSRHKGFTLINLLGLTVSMTACIFIFMYVNFELSYDKFHGQAEHIYRMTQHSNESAGRARVFGFLAPEVKEIFPEVKEYARLINLTGIMGNFVVSYEDKKFLEPGIFYSDPGFLTIFSFDLLAGDTQKALAEPYTAVLTQTTAQKYFGDENPIGKSVTLNAEESFRVTGVIENPPANSHLKFDFLLSFETLKDEAYMLSWADFYTYLLLKPGTDMSALTQKLNDASLLEKKYGESVANIQLGLQPLRDIHLYSDMEAEIEVNGNARTTYFLFLIAVFILIIAWINYVNLSTARSIDRAAEIAVKKVVGAQKRNLVLQHLVESSVLNAMAILLALGFTAELVPYFRDFTGKQPAFSLSENPLLWLLVPSLLFAGGLISSLYPALVISSFKPSAVLRKQFQKGVKGTRLKNAFVIFQFAASIFLIGGTIVVLQQLNFMRAQDLGVDITRTLVVQSPSISDSTYREKLSGFKTELLRTPKIQSVTASTNIPGRESTWGGRVRRFGAPQTEGAGVDLVGIDYHFLDSYKIELLAGRSFTQDFSTDQNTTLLNEAAMHELGYHTAEESIGSKVRIWRSDYRVIGIVKSHHQLSLQHEKIPTVYLLREHGGSFYSIKLGTGGLSETIRSIESEYTRFFPGNPFNFFFLDDYFDQQYRADRRFGQVFGVFAGIAIFVACLGLLALSSYAILKRTKEVGIRKVLGASVAQLFLLLSADFLKMILIANIIAVPIIWYVMQNWLQNYAFRIEIGYWLMILPAFLVMLIATATMSFQAIKAVTANPINALKYE